MRLWCIVAIMLAIEPADADPVTFEIKGRTLRVTADEDVKDLRIEFVRGDGKRFTVGPSQIAAGQSLGFTIGDGAGGRVSYTAKLSAQVGGKPWSDQIAIAGPLEIGYDLAHLDLDKH